MIKTTIGDRLKEEREASGLSAAKFAENGGKGRSAQFAYEKGDNTPDSVYLSNLYKHGVDIHYILTGVRLTSTLTKDENELITLYKNADISIKAAALAVLKSGITTTLANKVDNQINFSSGITINNEKSDDKK